jgi:transposase-like protein
MPTKKFTPELKGQILADKASGKTVAQLQQQYGVSPATVFQWQADMKRASTAAPAPIAATDLAAENARLRKVIDILLGKGG